MNIIMKKGKVDNSGIKIKKKKLGDGHWLMTAMLMPAVILTFLFMYAPMPGIVVAFKNFKFNQGIWGSKWCGFDNFKFLFESNTLGMLVRNTILYNVAILILGTIVSVILALALEKVKSKISIKIFQSSMFLPYFLSWIVVSYFTRSLFEYDKGMINAVISMFGGERISFYTTPSLWPFILTFFAIWKSMGYTTLIYYGQLLSIDPSLYEAAEIDGCNGFMKIKYISLPHLIQPIIIMMLLSIGGIFRSDYGLYYFLTNDSGTLYRATDVLDTYIFRTLKSATNLGFSSAIAFMQSVVGFFLVIIANQFARMYDKETALF